jgi:hypothetical protein
VTSHQKKIAAFLLDWQKRLLLAIVVIGGHSEHILLTVVSKLQCFIYGFGLLRHPVLESREVNLYAF